MNVLTYEQLKQRLDAVVAECAKAIAAVQTFADATEQLTEIIGDEIGMEGVANLLAAFAAVGNMPETTAALAEVEAKAIEKHIASLKKMLAELDPEIFAYGQVKAALESSMFWAEKFAVELRKGWV